MNKKDRIKPENLDVYRFRELIAAHTEYDTRLWCYVRPSMNEIKYAVEQGHNVTWFKTLAEAIAAYNAL